VPLASIHRYRARTRAKGRFRFLGDACSSRHLCLKPVG
jgi:hypothetical protein